MNNENRKENRMSDVVNPHDKICRETLSDKENARSLLHHRLPVHVSQLIDLDSLEISKDSFIEKDLSDYYSDMLYKVMLKGGAPGFVYVLFEHKSYYDRYLHLQLLGYMIKIWRLFIKQQKKKTVQALPIIIPLLICHGKRPWPENRSRLSSLLSGPVEKLSGYIPDFAFELYDLNVLSDEDIKGTIMTRVVMLLLKHVFDLDLQKKLPDILSLMKTLMAKETGLQYLETVFRYLSGTMDNISTEEIKGIVQQAFSVKEGEYIMSLAEKLRKEGELRGEIRGEIRGLKDAIELGMTLKFPDHVKTVMAEVKKIDDLGILQKIKEAIKNSSDVSQILYLFES